MQNTLTFPPLRPSETDVIPTFNVVIIYEDFETGKHAKKTYDFLAEHLGDECVFTNQMWKFDVLAVGKLRDMAAKDAAAADIIIVAAHGTNDLPSEVKAWTEAWSKERTRAIAIVGLFDTPEYLDNPARTYLAEAARRARMEFFSQPGVWPGTNNEETHSLDNWDRNKTFSVLADMVQMQPGRNISHWGINE